MQKYIKFTDKYGKKIEQGYSDSALMDLLHSYDSGQAYMTIIDDISTSTENLENISVVFYNKVPADKDAVRIRVCDMKAGRGNEACRQFILNLEKLLVINFPDKHLFSQKEQVLNLLKILDETSLPEDIDYRKEKIFDNILPHDDIQNITYNDREFLKQLQNDVEFLNGIHKVMIKTEYGEFLDVYNDYAYAIIVFVYGPDDYCEIDIYEWLENYDGIEKIKAFMSHLRDIITEKWPEIPIAVDYKIEREKN